MLDLKEFDNYIVNRDGTIQGQRTEIIKPFLKSRYYYVTLFTKTEHKRKDVKVHRLVAYRYLPDFDYALEVDHIDNNKSNNNAENLQMVTRRANLIKDCGTKSKITVKCIEDNITFDSMAECARHYNISHQRIRNAIHDNQNYIKSINKTIIRSDSNETDNAGMVNISWH